MNVSVGIDIGGTFTDVVVCPDDGSPATIAKVPTTPADPGIGLVTGLGRALDAAGVDPSDVSWLVHGTTVGTNAVLERAGARIGIITTAGFEDVLFIGRAKRAKMYDLFAGPTTPGFLCPRRRIHGVRGRVDPAGRVVDALDEAAVERAVATLVDDDRVDAIAVSLLFSFADPSMERRVEEIVRAHGADTYVSLSSRIDPRFREFERLVVTAFDAYIRPKLATYIRGLRGRLRHAGVPSPLQVMESHGGIVASELVEERAAGTLLSGLAGGATGAAAVAAQAGHSRVLGFDMGGTSTDVTLIVDGSPLVDDEGRLSGQPLRLPMVDVHTVGAGGGSIAYVDAAGSLRVGPRSAGADPGPASYGRGGNDPTVTDANVVLGFLGGSGLAGGRLRLSPELAEKALRTRVADRLGMDLVRAAWGVHRLANAAMSAAVRVVSVARGYDPRRFALIASGGAGPLHACSIADDLGIGEILVPPHPGVLSAYGLLAADTRVNRWRTYRARLGEDDPAGLVAALDGVAGEAADEVARATSEAGLTAQVTRAVDARYVGQSHELTVPVPATADAGEVVESVAAGFHERHRLLYGQYDPDGRVEVAAVRATATVPRTTPALAPATDTGALDDRQVYLPERETFATVPVLPRGAVPDVLPGPAVVVQPDTTTLVRLGWTARTHPSGTLVLSRDATARPELP